MRILLIVFVVLPILEMWLLIEVGGVIGALPTIGLVFLTAFIGLGLLKIQSAATLISAREKLRANQLPAREIADGVFYAVGGALLLTPGFITDFIGFACLIPGIRTWIIQLLLRSIVRKGHFHVYVSRPTKNSRGGSERIIDGDFKRHFEE